MCGQGECGEEHERVREVSGHEQRPGHRFVLGHQAEEDEGRPDRGLDEDQEDRRRGRPAGGMPLRPLAEDPDRQDEHQEERQATREAGVYSTIVSSIGAWGTTSPLQRGQWAPQPAPDPVARTKAPHKMTATFQPSVSQAKRASDVT